MKCCRYRRAGFSYVRTTTNVQIPGFKDCDTYDEVIEKGAQGLGLSSTQNLQSVVSGGIVKDSPLNVGDQWTLGGLLEDKMSEGRRHLGSLYLTVMMKIETRFVGVHTIEK